MATGNTSYSIAYEGNDLVRVMKDLVALAADPDHQSSMAEDKKLLVGLVSSLSSEDDNVALLAAQGTNFLAANPALRTKLMDPSLALTMHLVSLSSLSGEMQQWWSSRRFY